MAKTKRTIDEIDNDSGGSNVEYSDEEAPRSKKTKKEKAKTVSKPQVSEDEFWSVSCRAVPWTYSTEGNLAV